MLEGEFYLIRAAVARAAAGRVTNQRAARGLELVAQSYERLARQAKMLSEQHRARVRRRRSAELARSDDVRTLPALGG